MTRRIVAFALLVSTLAGCAASEAVTRQPSAGPAVAVEALGPAGTTGATGATGPSPSATPPPDGIPAPDEPIPLGGRELALSLARTYEANRESIAEWSLGGDPGVWPPPRDVILLTLYEQRMYRLLASKSKLAAHVLDRLERPLFVEAGANVRASHALFEHFAPVTELPDFRIRKPEPADVLLGYFQEAEDRFDVEWEVLAAVMLIETRMGRIRSHSSAGAQGPMQFLPPTWDAYGMGGNIRDPHDAVLGAANYLHASGAPDDYRGALRHYNPVDAYVNAVWSYAKTMMRFPEAYYAYYNWQVYVRTVDGDVRLSGPGL
jgi:transglycosylase-like protein with SLT domain